MLFEAFGELLRRLFWFVSYVSNINSFPKSLTPDEERELIRRYEQGDADAKDLLVEHNLRLVAHIAKKYSSPGACPDADDLISVGTIGLIKGVNSFRSGKGTKLSTYIARCIENAIITVRQTELAELVGIDVSTLKHYESLYN